MTDTVIRYLGSTVDRLLSPIIWHDMPLTRIMTGQADGTFIFDDFKNLADHTSDQSTQQYDSYVDNNAQAIARTDDGAIPRTLGQGGVGGVLEVNSNGTDNDELVLSTYNPSFVVSSTAANARKLAFECRIAKESIANDALAFFVGLAYDDGSNVTVAKTLALTDDDANLGAFTYLGFHVDQANGDSVDGVYKAEGQSATVNLAGLHVPVADTYVKLGFKFDPIRPAGNRITWYVNSVEQSTYVTATNISAATFPDDEAMAMVLVAKVGAGAASEFYMDWWACAQLN